MLRNPPNEQAIVRKRLQEGLNLGKSKGRSGGITGFQTTLNTSYFSSPKLRWEG